MTAAPLKRLDPRNLGQDNSPRSHDRGPIEALPTNSPSLSIGIGRLRGRRTAAPLKRDTTELYRRREERESPRSNDRGPIEAGTLDHRQPAFAHSPRSHDRGPIEARKSAAGR